MNDYESKLEKITTERAAAYRRLLAGELPSSSNGAQTRLKLEKLKILATGLHRVVAYPVTVETQSAFLMKPTGVGDAAASKVDPADTFVAFVCDCEEFMRSGGTICACSLAVAAARFSKGNSHINLDHLLEETAATRRPVGRPRKAEHGSCYGGGGGAAGGGGSSSSGAGRHTPHFYHSTIMSSGALRFHKWRVVVDFEGEKCVGTIVSYRDDYHEERKPYTSKTPFTRLWKCRFYLDAADVFEEYDAKDLAKHLSLAHSEGARGPAPESGNGQLMALPAAPAPAPPRPPQRRRATTAPVRKIPSAASRGLA